MKVLAMSFHLVRVMSGQSYLKPLVYKRGKDVNITLKLVKVKHSDHKKEKFLYFHHSLIEK